MGILLGVIVWIVIICIGIGVYLLPAYVAKKRNHQNFLAIAAVDILFGWTFLGWGIALVWALTKQKNASA